MNTNKQQYIVAIRSNTSYPTYRGMIGIIGMLGYILAAFCALGSLISGLGAMGSSFVGGLGILIAGFIFSALIFFFARFWKEAASILADIADSIADTNSRAESTQ